MPRNYPARQSLQASQAIARLHQLDPARVLFKLIDQGVFHNDVIALANANVLFFHQLAFVDNKQIKYQLRQRWGPTPLYCLEVQSTQVSVQEAISSYLLIAN